MPSAPIQRLEGIPCAPPHLLRFGTCSADAVGVSVLDRHLSGWRGLWWLLAHPAFPVSEGDQYHPLALLREPGQLADPALQLGYQAPSSLASALGSIAANND